jgi:hypothetical protein
MVWRPKLKAYSGFAITYDFQRGTESTRLERLINGLNVVGYTTLHANDTGYRDATEKYKSAFGIENPAIEAVLRRGRVAVVVSAGWEIAIISSDWRRVLAFTIATQTEIQRVLALDDPTPIDYEPKIKENLRDRVVQSIASVVSGVGAGAAFAYSGILGFEGSVLLAGAAIGIAQLILRSRGHITSEE